MQIISSRSELIDRSSIEISKLWISHLQMGGSVRHGVTADAGGDHDQRSVSFVLSRPAHAARDPGES